MQHQKMYPLPIKTIIEQHHLFYSENYILKKKHIKKI